MQKINFQVAVEIPSDLVIIEKSEYEALQSEALVGIYWTMPDLEGRIGKKQVWIKENILYVPRFKKELQKFVYYPQVKGEKWSFHAGKMAKFLDDNFYAIFNP